MDPISISILKQRLPLLLKSVSRPSSRQHGHFSITSSPIKRLRCPRYYSSKVESSGVIDTAAAPSSLNPSVLDTTKGLRPISKRRERQQTTSAPTFTIRKLQGRSTLREAIAAQHPAASALQSTRAAKESQTPSQPYPVKQAKAAKSIPTSASSPSKSPSQPAGPNRAARRAAARIPLRLTLPYHVSRSFSNNLPIYTEFKGHGSLKLTLVRKISGDANTLKNELVELLSVKPKDAAVVQPANYIKIKGQYTDKIQKFLLDRGF